MTIGDLKGWLKAIPDTFDDMNVVYRTYDSTVDPAAKKEEEKDLYYALDAPVVSGFIDEDSRECCFLDEKSRAFIVKMNETLKGEPQK